MSNLGLNKYWTGKYKIKDLVQLKNPITGHMVLVDKEYGNIIAHKVSKGSYKNIKEGSSDE